MIHFYEELVKLAQELADKKSTKDDIKASIDLIEIANMRNTACPTKEFIASAKQLDKHMCDDYPEIDEMHTIASKMERRLETNQERTKSEYDLILNVLKFDMYGILVSVLLKHKKISSIKDFIESVD